MIFKVNNARPLNTTRKNEKKVLENETKLSVNDLGVLG